MDLEPFFQPAVMKRYRRLADPATPEPERLALLFELHEESGEYMAYDRAPATTASASPITLGPPTEPLLLPAPVNSSVNA